MSSNIEILNNVVVWRSLQGDSSRPSDHSINILNFDVG